MHIITPHILLFSALRGRREGSGPVCLCLPVHEGSPFAGTCCVRASRAGPVLMFIMRSRMTPTPAV